MDRAGEIDLALDVDDFALAQAGGGGDAARITEGFPQRSKTESPLTCPTPAPAVAISSLPRGIASLHLRAQAADPVALRIDRPLSRRGPMAARPLACPIVGLVQQIEQFA